MSTSMQIRRLWFLVSFAVVVIALLIPPAASRTDKERKGDDDRDAQVIKVAASCTRKCHDLCAVLPKSEDPSCDQRCDSITTVFNGSVKDPAALPRTAFPAVLEMQLCWTGCLLRRRRQPQLQGQVRRHLPPLRPDHRRRRQDHGGARPRCCGDFKLDACSDACNRKCAATASQGKTKQACGGSCAEACGLYGGATTVLQAAMPPAAVQSPAALGDGTIANTFKDCNEHYAANDNKCATKCTYACYIITKAKASMKLATGGFGMPA